MLILLSIWLIYKNQVALVKKGCLSASSGLILSLWSTTSILESKSIAYFDANLSLLWLIKLDHGLFEYEWFCIIVITSLSGFKLYFLT
jgi:hypothetical protein